MQQTALVTGASKGIGFALANLLAKQNYKVIGTSRAGEVIENKNIEMLPLNLAQQTSIIDFAKLIEAKKITFDLYINNAAIGPDLDKDLPEWESFSQTMDSNVTGTVFLTEAMIAFLNSNAKIINVSSKMGSIDMCTGMDAVAYRMSKTAINMYSKILTNRLKGKHKIATIHPGWVRTTLSSGNSQAPLSIEESAAYIAEFIASDFKTGVYWNAPEKKEINW
jgi:NAD(P)-dependent dehydrogenase (short-subunit alcohol dehydrogenase family)